MLDGPAVFAAFAVDVVQPATFHEAGILRAAEFNQTLNGCFAEILTVVADHVGQFNEMLFAHIFVWFDVFVVYFLMRGP